MCCLLLVVFGLLDCATTVAGIAFCGAKEGNIFLVSVTETNLFVFAGIKLVAVVLTGVLFYNAGKFAGPVFGKLQVGRWLFQVSFCFSFLVSGYAVVNNVLVVAGFV